ncbi:unnamed protein product [Orchesella dallaii]|uniref:Charged multivesicular body protein 3 n=1 Tax=Orchesella dallaii TaxID=48710 RepID=A0ABP1RKJ4_9HEXA
MGARLGKGSTPPDLKVQVAGWRNKIRRESMALDRQIYGIRREEEKIKASVKEAAKKGNNDLSRFYAKELIRSRQALSKINVSKANLSSILMHVQEQLAILRASGSLQKSTQVMQAVAALIQIPQLAHTMKELSKQMIKAGIMEEIINETVESLEYQEELEGAADGEIDEILWEITAGQIGRAPVVIMDGILTPYPSREYVDSDEEDGEEREKVQSGLEALRS